MKKLILALALAAAALPGCESLGIGPIEGGSAIVGQLGQQALDALIAYAESHGWTRAQVATATNEAAACLAAVENGSRGAGLSPEGMAWARSYSAGR